MGHGHRGRYRRNWLRGRWASELFLLGWFAICGLTTRIGVPVQLAVWGFFGGVIVLALAGSLKPTNRSRPAPVVTGPPNPVQSKRAFGAVVAVMMVVAFSAVLFWPSSDRLPLPRSAIVESSPVLRSFPCRVVSVHDGDTLRCADGTRVRLHAVAAREIDGTCSPGHPCPSASAEAARDALRRLAANDTITCVPTGESYDRVTAICRNGGGVEINCAMVRSGTAVVWESFNRQVPICGA